MISPRTFNFSRVDVIVIHHMLYDKTACIDARHAVFSTSLNRFNVCRQIIVCFEHGLCVRVYRGRCISAVTVIVFNGYRDRDSWRFMF